jgi:hypothetical protein
MLKIGKALLKVAGVGGIISDAERKWIVGSVAATVTDDESHSKEFEQLRTFSEEKRQLRFLFPQGANAALKSD